LKLVLTLIEVATTVQICRTGSFCPGDSGRIAEKNYICT
jgi:hypothetical protein